MEMYIIVLHSTIITFSLLYFYTIFIEWTMKSYKAKASGQDPIIMYEVRDVHYGMEKYQLDIEVPREHEDEKRYAVDYKRMAKDKLLVGLLPFVEVEEIDTHPYRDKVLRASIYIGARR